MRGTTPAARLSPPPASPLSWRAYVDAGANGVFVPRVAGDADIQTLADGIDVPLNILLLPGRHRYARLAELA